MIKPQSIPAYVISLLEPYRGLDPEHCWPPRHPARIRDPYNQKTSEGLKSILFHLLRGPAPLHTGLSTTCGSSTCVNPWHMKVTKRGNSLTLYRRRKARVDGILADTMSSRVMVEEIVEILRDKGIEPTLDAIWAKVLELPLSQQCFTSQEELRTLLVEMRP